MSESFYQNQEEGGRSCMLYSRDLLDQAFPLEERKKFRQLRLAKNVKSFVLYNYTGGEIPSDAMGERIKIDEKKYPFTCDISMHGDSVRIAILGKKLSGIYIKSKEFAETLESLFLIAFDSCKNK